MEKNYLQSLTVLLLDWYCKTTAVVNFPVLVFIHFHMVDVCMPPGTGHWWSFSSEISIRISTYFTALSL